MATMITGKELGIQKLQDEISDIKKELREHDDWRQRLDRHDSQIENLIKGLESEKEARAKGEDRLSKSIEELNKTFVFIRGGAFAMYFIGGCIIAGIVYFLLSHFSKIMELLGLK